MSFSSENREKTLRFVLTFHGQATDKLPTSYRQATDRFFGELFFTITDIIYEPSTQPPSLPVAVIVKFDSFSGPSLADSMPSCVPITPITATV